MATISIRDLIFRFKDIANKHPQINAFGSGPIYHILNDITYYPYLWLVNDIPHDVIYTDDNKYRAIEYNFIVRIGDKVNNQSAYGNKSGLGSNNELDISSDTFTMLVDVINAISENSLGLFGDVKMIGDIDIEPFFNEDTGDVNGHQANIILRTKIEAPCFSPLTDSKI